MIDSQVQVLKKDKDPVPTMKGNSTLESFFVSKPVSSFLDRLNLGIQPFTGRIGNRLSQIGQNIINMTLDQVRHIPHRFQAAVSHPPEPSFPDVTDGVHCWIRLESPDDLLSWPRRGRLSGSGTEGIETLPVVSPGGKATDTCFLSRSPSYFP